MSKPGTTVSRNDRDSHFAYSVEQPASNCRARSGRSRGESAACSLICAIAFAAMQPATAVVADIVEGIVPFDDLERHHVATALGWLRSTDDIFRRVKPATPSPHLVAYVVLVDPEGRGVYLGRHRMAGLHLPMGGHVEPGEHPLAAARREAGEELGIDPVFDVVGERPFFLTVTTTVGRTAGHVDVSLWHVIGAVNIRSTLWNSTVGSGGISIRTGCPRPIRICLDSCASSTACCLRRHTCERAGHSWAPEDQTSRLSVSARFCRCRPTIFRG